MFLSQKGNHGKGQEGRKIWRQITVYHTSATLIAPVMGILPKSLEEPSFTRTC